MTRLPYRSYSDYLTRRYGQKVYKLPIKLAGSCPNRDGTIGEGGCDFCSEEGGSFENLPTTLSVREQIRVNREYIEKKYKAKLFIAYFQNYTNTYMTDDAFQSAISEALEEEVVALYISTRPDSITDGQLAFLSELQREKGVDVVMELGLQTANYHILYGINRGHGIAEFVHGVLRCKAAGLGTCVHVLIGLPGDEDLDAVETAKLISVLGVDQVKLHALYITEGSKFAEQFVQGELSLIEKETFIQRAILFLRHLDREIVIQRLLGRSPEEISLFSNWGSSWWVIRDEIIERMIADRMEQGDHCDYLKPKVCGHK
ncbi:MAG: TIGR01212 family radical SAM protein [Tissierellia bacterium]|nr:TIGR01212 family radical SAM protein [Tissierellia bacterium]